MTVVVENRSRQLIFPHARPIELTAGRPALLGVVNLTPDSFSDGGRFLEPDRALEHALQLAAEGADLLDLGAESTRPGGGVYGQGAHEVPAGEELARLLPVLERLRPLLSIPISVDTRKAEVARAALAAGADLINDVSAFGDPEMGAVVAAAGCPVILMHSRGALATMQSAINFRDLVTEVGDELEASAARALALGVARERILLDPGLGFGKSAPQNLRLIAATGKLAARGWPLVVGASRKSFLGTLTGAAVEARLPSSLAAAAVAASGGAVMLRVHDVAATRQFLTVWRALVDEAGEHEERP